MAQVSVRKRSRLRFGNLVTVDGIVFWDLLKLPDLVVQPDDIAYRIEMSDRIDLLANTYYGDPVLWWVIALANDMEFLPTDFNIGALIRIPSPRYVLQVLFTNTNN